MGPHLFFPFEVKYLYNQGNKPPEILNHSSNPLKHATENTWVESKNEKLSWSAFQTLHIVVVNRMGCAGRPSDKKGRESSKEGRKRHSRTA